MTELLPIADGPELRRHARRLARRHRAALAGVVGLHALAAAAGLILTDRYADWHRTPLTATSTQHISVYAHAGEAL